MLFARREIMIVIVGTEIQNIVRINVNYFDERVKYSRFSIELSA